MNTLKVKTLISEIAQWEKITSCQAWQPNLIP